ncbi:MAG: peroxiredoxin-like family protein [Planctomycetaceae bacterium]
MTKFSTGDTIPSQQLTTIQLQPVPIPDAESLVHLQFRRFAGCGACNLHLRSIARRHAEIVSAGVREVAVFHSPASALLPYQDDLPFAVVADPGKTLYARFGVESSIWSVLAPRALLSFLRGFLTLKKKPAPPKDGESIIGLPADFLIGPDGRVLACKYGTHAYDQWSVDEILALARQFAGPSENSG